MSGLVLRRGEILAVAGVAGNGQRELVEMLVGLRRPESGRVEILGRDWQRFFREPIRGEGGLAYIPEESPGPGCLSRPWTSPTIFCSPTAFSLRAGLF